jgi:hypothetical protein
LYLDMRDADANANSAPATRNAVANIHASGNEYTATGQRPQRRGILRARRPYDILTSHRQRSLVVQLLYAEHSATGWLDTNGAGSL